MAGEKVGCSCAGAGAHPGEGTGTVHAPRGVPCTTPGKLGSAHPSPAGKSVQVGKASSPGLDPPSNTLQASPNRLPEQPGAPAFAECNSAGARQTPAAGAPTPPAVGARWGRRTAQMCIPKTLRRRAGRGVFVWAALGARVARMTLAAPGCEQAFHLTPARSPLPAALPVAALQAGCVRPHTLKAGTPIRQWERRRQTHLGTVWLDRSGGRSPGGCPALAGRASSRPLPGPASGTSGSGRGGSCVAPSPFAACPVHGRSPAGQPAKGSRDPGCSPTPPSAAR